MTYGLQGSVGNLEGSYRKPEKEWQMETETSSEGIDFASRFRRSQGRNPRTFSANTKVTRAEHNELEAAASAEGKALGEWSREVLLKAARGHAADPGFTEIIALRLLLNSVLRRVACGETMSADAFNLEMQSIRTSKHKAAEEVMQQYAATGKSK
jgi:hypothetical protein